MAKLLLILHVLAGIIFIGPVTVAVSLFPRYARLATEPEHRASALAVLALLRRISSVYTVLGISVPVLGVGVAAQLGVLGDAWLVISMLITAAAAALLALVVLPAQVTMLDELGDPDSPVVRAGLSAGDDRGQDDLPAVRSPITNRHSDAENTDLDAGTPEVASPFAQALSVDAVTESWRRLTVRLAMSSGIFALMWAIVVALMVIRPGSTTSV